MPIPNKDKTLSILCASLWLGAIAIGISTMLTYESTPGASADPSNEWPTESAIKLSPDTPTLIMLAHPRCPCTRASIHELSRLLTQVEGRVKPYVVFVKPKGYSEDWDTTDLWSGASVIPGVIVISDESGTEAKRFQAATSGQTLLYDKTGKLLFQGGITGARGHEGENPGRAAIVSIINTGTEMLDQTAVYGCPLFERSEECRRTKEVGAKHDAN